MTTTYYRYDGYGYANTQFYVELEEYKVVRHTRCGVWLDVYGKETFVLHGTNGKRFAYPDKASALRSFIARKRRQIIYAKATLRKAEETLELALQGKVHDKIDGILLWSA